MATVSISDPATCSSSGGGPYQSVFVTITDVMANTSATASNSDSGWTDLTPNLKNSPMQIDLLGQANNSCFLATLGDAQELQAGSYQQIRLMLAPNNTSVSGNACANVNSANCIVLDDTAKDMYPLQLSSEAQTGLKIPSGQIANGGFNIAAGETKDLNIDFNTCSSIVKEGNGQYRLKPVLHAGEVSTTSTSINGKVSVTAAGGGTFSGSALVALEQVPTGDTTNTDRIVQTTLVNPDGSFVFCPIPAGTYDVVVVAVDTNGVVYEPSIVTGITNGETTGTINVYPVSATGTYPVSTAPPVPAGAIAVTGQVTTQTSASAGVGESVELSALEKDLTSGVTYTIPMPPTTLDDMSATLEVETSATPTPTSPSCPSGTYCANFTMSLPVGAPNIGAWSSGGTTLTQGSGLAAYTVDGIADGCTNPSEQTEAVTLTPSGSAAITLANPLAFGGCS